MRRVLRKSSGYATVWAHQASVQVLRKAGQLIDVTVEDDSGDSTLKLFPPDDLDFLEEAPPSPKQWPARLLGRFDPLLLAHVDKGCWVDKEHYKRVWHHTHIEAVLLVKGRIRGIWRYEKTARGLTITLELFGDVNLPTHVERTIGEQAADIAAFLGLPLIGLDLVAGS